MLLRLPSAAARFAVLILAVALAAALSFFSIRNARAAYNSSLNTRSGYEAAARLEPADSGNWYLLGRYWQYNLDDPDPRRAILNFRRALALNPRSADAWLDLGNVFESEGDFPAARESFLQARKAYPASAAVSWRYGNFLLRLGEIPQAFAEFRRAVYTEPNRSAEAFSRCWRVNPDIQSILNNVIPPDHDAYLDVIRELGYDNQIPSALIAWQRLVSLHKPLSPRDAIPLADLLIQKQQISEARRVWDDAIRLSNVSTGDPQGSVLWDGGFESNVIGGGFAWVFPEGYNGVRASMDAREKHSGKQSLRLIFDGKRNPSLDAICNNLNVQPNTTYRLSAWTRTQNLTTDEGIRFRILSYSNGVLASFIDSTDSRGTQPWTPVEMSWTSAKDIHRARVCIQRNISHGFDGRISGTAWVDDLSLVPVGTLRP